ncbi:MAG: tRNA (adenosine(37)-N6)-dimethylallyltransferase MiaA [Gammaproteobacteria bacterium]|nr:tRNA (adenosine(37)-N6)-dimethylallyltransferase MiaA [Gammaproteobacteria bacterium]
MGPTASGKTDLAVELVERLPVEIISVDSAMVYRGLDIGTAKPPREILARAPHRLIDICDPAEPYSAGRFREDARREIEDVFRRGHAPLLVGGTGLYFRALQSGLAVLPPADPEVRHALTRDAGRIGWEGLHRRLAEVDPAAAARIHASDPQRIQRALEVHRLTGRTLSEHFRRGRRDPLPFPLIKLAVAPADRSLLRERARKRYLAMLGHGLLEEIRALYARGDLHPELPSMRLVGYRHGWRHLAGEISLEEMTREAISATQQLAKRQLTWLRGEETVNWFDALSADLLERVLKFIRQSTNFPDRV